MLTYKQLSEGIKLQYIRDKGQGVMKMWDTKKKDGKWAEVRGKLGYEGNKYDPKDPLHKAIDALGKSASISDFMNGDVVAINPHHPDGKKALQKIKKLMK